MKVLAYFITYKIRNKELTKQAINEMRIELSHTTDIEIKAIRYVCLSVSFVSINGLQNPARELSKMCYLSYLD